LSFFFADMPIIARSDARILIIRRDNIGDLVCTTPLIRALRNQLPRAHLAVLLTQYTAAVLAESLDLDAIYSYMKAKHRAPGTSIARLFLDRLRLIRKLRSERFDYVLLPGGAQPSSVRMARWLDAGRVLLRDGRDAVAGPHEVQQCCHLLSRLGLRYEIPPVRILPPSNAVLVTAKASDDRWRERGETIGLHISARKERQRWPAEKFIELARTLCTTRSVRIHLLWAPGGAENPQHPGDDGKAQSICTATAGLPVLPVRTTRLEELIAALAQCDRVICSDGGAMHLAAALGKPIVCLFGNSSPERWHPWGVPYQLLQPGSRNVNDIAVSEVREAYERLTQT
jgi:heptosyltransferase-3